MKAKKYSELIKAMETSSNDDLQQLQRLSIGRILLLGSRQEEDGDLQEYEQCRYLVMSAAAELEKRCVARG